MRSALEQAELALKNDEVPVGAVLVKNNRIICAAANTMNQERNPLKHAEMIMIEQALSILQTDQSPQSFTEHHLLENCDAYVTLEPCPMCLHALSMTRIRRIYFGAFAAHPSKNTLLTKNHHNCEIYGGIMEKQSVALLKEFFNGKR